MSFTLSTLKTAIQDYLQVSESTFTSQLNNFIEESEDSNQSSEVSLDPFSS